MPMDSPVTTARLSSTFRPRLDDVLPASISSLGVTLFIDRENENYYIEATEDHDSFAMVALVEFARGVELELMGEDECPALHLEHSVRIYLAEMVA